MTNMMTHLYHKISMYQFNYKQYYNREKDKVYHFIPIAFWLTVPFFLLPLLAQVRKIALKLCEFQSGHALLQGKRFLSFFAIRLSFEKIGWIGLQSWDNGGHPVCLINLLPNFSFKKCWKILTWCDDALSWIKIQVLIFLIRLTSERSSSSKYF